MCKRTYCKKPLKFEKQIDLLKSRDILDNWYDILAKIIAPKLEVKKYRRQMGFPDNWQEHPLLPKFEVKK